MVIFALQNFNVAREKNSPSCFSVQFPSQGILNRRVSSFSKGFWRHESVMGQLLGGNDLMHKLCSNRSRVMLLLSLHCFFHHFSSALINAVTVLFLFLDIIVKPSNQTSLPQTPAIPPFHPHGFLSQPDLATCVFVPGIRTPLFWFPRVDHFGLIEDRKESASAHV